ncbi:MAG: hypothetical protein ACP5VE_07040 [Chthonomonadales bacterium]
MSAPPAALELLRDLRHRYPDTPFLALGQTIWWDEPMKAVLCCLLQAGGLGGSMTVGIHDTDYFAKLKVRQAGQSRFELMPHNDGSTKELWSAAGEISRLFGAECIPTRQDLLRHGVPLARIMRHHAQDPQTFLNQVTEAWGWRGLVYTGSRNLIVHHLPLRLMGSAVEEMLQWGFEGTLETIADPSTKAHARALADRLLKWVRDYRDAHPDAMLTDLYQHLLPCLYQLLLEGDPPGIQVNCTAHLLLLSPDTAHLPRFEFVDLFLNERTRRLAADAYNHAVEGTEIYTLDRFGLGALPFDLVLPKQGRGTLRVTLRAVHVETPEPIRIPLEKPIRSVRDLAEVLAAHLGEHVTLVGKAVALIPMLAREFLFVFNEEGSEYVRLTRKMNDYLRRRGVHVAVHPILRMRYHTWDAMAECGAQLNLPEHLAAALGRPRVGAWELAAEWRPAVDAQSRLLERLKGIRKPRELMAFLAERDRGEWGARLEEYNRAKARMVQLRSVAAEVQAQVVSLYGQLKGVKRQIVATERERGDHFRRTEQWTAQELARREALGAQVAHLLDQRRELLERIHRLKQQRLDLERGAEAQSLRRHIEELEVAAEVARMTMVRNAILATRSMVHTQHRPSAWWFPMLDGTGRWFRRIVETVELYTEPLVSE